MRVPARVVVPLLLAASIILATVAVHGLRQGPVERAGPEAPAARPSPAPVDNQHHLYVLDGWGGVHPVGDSPDLATTASWPQRDIAFSLALFPDGTGGYVLDGFGGLHPVGEALPVDSTVYWPHWVGAREVVMAPWATSAEPAGYVLDADGGIHAFGGAPKVEGNATWPGQGLARGMVLTANSNPGWVMGYTLDAAGGIHPFGGAVPVDGAAGWPGQDMARGLVLVPGLSPYSIQGYTLDAHGGVNPFGGAPSVFASASWPGQDVADSIVAWTSAPAGSPGGWVLDRQGAVHAFGSAPTLASAVSWPGWDIARGLAGAGSGSGSVERLVLDPEPISNGWGAYYNQRDARWASVGVGPASYPIWQVGCLLADLAMVYSHFGFPSVTPATIAAHSTWFNSRGEIYNSALNVPGHTTEIRQSPSPAWISGQLAAGHPVIVGMNLPDGGTHFVTLTGLDGTSDYWTDDPWEQNAQHVTFTGFWFDRGSVFEGIAFA